ncbi:MAG: hypothetical protein C4348_00720, partial [Patescibacteria group bacterium]
EIGKTYEIKTEIASLPVLETTSTPLPPISIRIPFKVFLELHPEPPKCFYEEPRCLMPSRVIPIAEFTFYWKYGTKDEISYLWKIPETIESGRYKLGVNLVDEFVSGHYRDESDDYFEIVKKETPNDIPAQIREIIDKLEKIKLSLPENRRSLIDIAIYILQNLLK